MPSPQSPNQTTTGKYVLTPRQELALSSTCYELLYGGAKGGGKSELLLLLVIWQMMIADAEYRRTGVPSRGRAVLFRKDFTRMGDILRRAATLFPQADPDAQWNLTTHTWTFACGYVMTFAQLHEPGSEQQWQGQEITLLLFDQLEEIPQAQYEFLKMQVRSTDDVMRPRLRVVSSANPLGKYAKWVKAWFVTGVEPGQIQVETITDPDDGHAETIERVFIPAKLKDNPHLYSDRKYWAKLARLSPARRAAFLDGDWDAVEDGYFCGVFDKNSHVKRMTIPRSWQLLMVGDWGARNPAAWYLATKDNDGNLHIAYELYGPGGTGSAWGREILEKLEKMNLDPAEIEGYLDAGAWQRHGSDGFSPGEKLNQMGLRFWRAEHPHDSRIPGWVEVSERLMLRWCPECHMNMVHAPGCSQSKPQIPGLTIDPQCLHLIEQLANAMPDEDNPEDVDTDQEDHAIDAIRYLCCAFPITESMRGKVDESAETWEALLRSHDALRAGLQGRRPVENGYGYGQ